MRGTGALREDRVGEEEGSVAMAPGQQLRPREVRVPAAPTSPRQELVSGGCQSRPQLSLIQNLLADLCRLALMTRSLREEG